MARRAADCAGVGCNRPERQPQPIEDPTVSIEHDLITRQCRIAVAIEGIGILHREFTSAHHTEARPALVAKLGLDVIEIFRHLPVAAQFLACHVGDHLFRGRLHDEIAAMPILDAQQFGAVLLPSPRLLPEFCRLNDRHQQFDRAGTVHFIANDRLDLADDPQPHRHVGVDPTGQSLDHAGPHH